MIAQFIDVATNFIWVGLAAFIALKIIDMIVGNRVSPEVELMGLDLPETGILAYPRDAM